jgi:octaprenyl-diphosphate synthase
MELAKKLIEKELDLFEQHFKDAVKSRVSLLDRIMQYIVKRKGKQMRPMFVLLSAKLHGEINNASYRAGSVVEL